MSTLWKRYLILLILMVRLIRLANSRISSRLLGHQRVHGLGRLVGHIIAATILCPIHLCTVSGMICAVKISFVILCLIAYLQITKLICRYLDQLGMSATYDTKTYCRQTLIGGNYGLLNTTTFVPNPDYYR